MQSIADQINGNHFAILVMCILGICTLIAFANAKNKLFKKLRIISITYMTILLFFVSYHQYINLNINVFAISQNTETEVKENIISGNLVIKILQFVKRAY